MANIQGERITALATDTTPATGDKFIMDSASEGPRQIDYDALATAILNKLTSKTFTLDAGTKTLIAALNELNSKTTPSQTVITVTTDQPTSQLDAFIGTMGAYESRFIEIQVESAITIGSYSIAPGRRFAIAFRHSNANYACVMLMSWIKLEGIEFMVRNNGSWTAKLIS